MFYLSHVNAITTDKFADDKDPLIPIYVSYINSDWVQMQNYLDLALNMHIELWKNNKWFDDYEFNIFKFIEWTGTQFQYRKKLPLTKNANKIIRRVSKLHQLAKKSLLVLKEEQVSSLLKWYEQDNEKWFHEFSALSQKFHSIDDFAVFLECYLKSLIKVTEPFLFFQNFAVSESWDHVLEQWKSETFNHYQNQIIEIYSTQQIHPGFVDWFLEFIDLFLNDREKKKLIKKLSENPIIINEDIFNHEVKIENQFWVIPENYFLLDHLEFNIWFSAMILEKYMQKDIIDTIRFILASEKLNSSRIGILQIMEEFPKSAIRKDLFMQKLFIFKMGELSIDAVSECLNYLEAMKKYNFFIMNDEEKEIWLTMQVGKLLDLLGFKEEAFYLFQKSYQLMKPLKDTNILEYEKFVASLAFFILEQDGFEYANVLIGQVANQNVLRESFLQNSQLFRHGYQIGSSPLSALSWKVHLFVCLKTLGSEKKWNELANNNLNKKNWNLLSYLIQTHVQDQKYKHQFEIDVRDEENQLQMIPFLKNKIRLFQTQIISLQKMESSFDQNLRLENILINYEHTVKKFRELRSIVLANQIDSIDYQLLFNNFLLIYDVCEYIWPSQLEKEKLYLKFNEWVELFQKLPSLDRANFPVDLGLISVELGRVGDQFVQLILHENLDIDSVQQFLEKNFYRDNFKRED